MDLTENTVNLILDLEYYIGSNCYNPNSYDGWQNTYGCSYRYPVWYRTPNGDSSSTRISIGKKNSDPSIVQTIHYKFGSNHLYVGLGLMEVLENLERRYDLDFDALEKERKSKAE